MKDLLSKLHINKRNIPAYIMMLNLILSFAMVSSFLGIYLNQVGISLGEIGVIFAFGAIIAGVLRFPIGAISDNYGRKPLILLGAIGYPIFALGVAFANTTTEFIAVRVFVEIFIAIFWTAFFAYIYDTIKKGEEGRELSIQNIFSGSGSILGPLIAGFVIARYGFVNLFYLAAVIGTLSLILLAFILKETGKTQKGVRLQRIVQEYNDIIQIKKFRILLTIGILHNISWVVWYIYMPIYLKDIGFAMFEIGTILSAVAVLFVIISYPLGWLTDHIHTKYLIIPGFIFIWLGGYAFFLTQKYVYILVSRLTLSTGFNLTWAPLVARLSHLTPKREHGGMVGLYRAGNSIATGLTSIAAGYLAQIYGLKMLLYGASALGLIVAVWLLFVKEGLLEKGIKIVKHPAHFIHLYDDRELQDKKG